MGDGRQAVQRLAPASHSRVSVREPLQAVFTDGLTHVSLFVEPVDSRRDHAELAGQLGATATLRQRRGLHWITVMGDVPPATLRAFADALRRR